MFRVTNKTKTKVYANGDYEIITIPNKFQVIGRYSLPPYPEFNSEEKAREFAKQCTEFETKFPFECPRSEKELKRGEKYANYQS